MANYSQLVTLIRRKVGFPEPETGGDDKLDNDTIIGYINDACDAMTDGIYGFDDYVEFTIDAAGTITVTVPAAPAAQPTVAARTPAVGGYTFYTIDDARSYEQFENKTAEIDDSDDRIMIKKPLNDPLLQATYNRTVTYLRYYSLDGTRGWAMPYGTLGVTNTIGVTYRRTFTRYSIGDIEQTTGTGLNDLTLGGIYTVADGTTTEYAIQITTAGAQDKFKVSTDGGATYPGAEMDCATTATDIGNGLTLTFGAITGHTLNDEFEWAAVAPSFNLFEENEQRGYPVKWPRAECWADLDDLRAGQEADPERGLPATGGYKSAAKALYAFREKRITQDLTLDHSLADPLDDDTAWV